ncbi:MAG TPA: hypothetical protein DHV88_12785 [Roseburia sp.]|jgi:hypothetical protein|nr:hypothetical protein [Roseburia sp.]
MKNFLKKFTFEYKHQKALTDFKVKMQRLYNLGDDELKYVYITIQTKYEKKKDMLTLSLFVIALATIMNVWNKFFTFIKMVFEYTETLSGNYYDVVKISIEISFIIAASITVVVLAYVLKTMKDIRELKKKITMIESVIEERK